jgi:HlyD family secretion protein
MQRYTQLVASGVVSQLQLEEKQAAVRTTEAQVARARAALQPSAASVAIAQDRIAQATATGRATLATLRREQEALVQQRSQLQSQLIRDQQDLRQIETDLQKSAIRATSDGTVLRLNLRNPNQVAQSGDILAEIAPSPQSLLVKARVDTQDIGNVQPGQLAQLRISACPYPNFGTLKGTVTAVSPDAIVPNLNGAAPSPPLSLSTSDASYYEVTIQPEQMILRQGDRQCSLRAGMDAEANIISRQETFLAFGLRMARLLTNW